MTEFADNIKRLREEAGYSQDELARMIGKTRSAISQYENGTAFTRMGVVEDLARNPCDRSIRLKRQQRREKPEVDAGDVLAYIDATGGTLFERLVIMEMCAGLRHGEAVGMVRGDVREENGRAVLSVSKAVVSVNGRLIRKETKTALLRPRGCLVGRSGAAAAGGEVARGRQEPQDGNAQLAGVVRKERGALHTLRPDAQRLCYARLRGVR